MLFLNVINVKYTIATSCYNTAKSGSWPPLNSDVEKKKKNGPQVIQISFDRSNEEGLLLLRTTLKNALYDLYARISRALRMQYCVLVKSI